MINIKVNPKPPLYPGNSSTFGYSNSGNNKESNKENFSGQTFQDILKQKLEKQVSHLSEAPPRTLQVFFNRRPLY
jgi:hypothetical protein